MSKGVKSNPMAIVSDLICYRYDSTTVTSLTVWKEETKCISPDCSYQSVLLPTLMLPNIIKNPTNYWCITQRPILSRNALSTSRN